MKKEEKRTILITGIIKIIIFKFNSEKEVRVVKSFFFIWSFCWNRSDINCFYVPGLYMFIGFSFIQSVSVVLIYWFVIWILISILLYFRVSVHRYTFHFRRISFILCTYTISLRWHVLYLPIRLLCQNYLSGFLLI